MREAAILYMAQHAGEGEGMIYGLGGSGLIVALCILLLVIFIAFVLDIL